MNSSLMDRRTFLGRGVMAGAAAPAMTAAWPWSALAGDGQAEPGWRIGCYTRPWDQFECRVALDCIAEAGFKHAGIMTAKGKSWLILTVDSTLDEAAAIGGEVRKRGLETISVYAGEFPVAKSLAAGIEGLKKLIDICVACGSPNLMLAGTAEEKLYADYYRTIAECCDYAVAKGVGLSLKPHGGLNGTGPQCRQAIERVGHRNFRVWYDPGNIYYYSNGELDPVADAATVDGLVVGMSVKDYRHPKEVAVTPGAGLVKFPELFTRLKQGGFTSGPLVIECLDKGDAAKITAEAVKARKLLEAILREKT